MMPLPMNLFDICYKCFPYRHFHGKQITFSEICEFICCTRQHLFDIATTPIDVDLDIMSYHVPVSLFQFRPTYDHLIGR